MVSCSQEPGGNLVTKTETQVTGGLEADMTGCEAIVLLIRVLLKHLDEGELCSRLYTALEMRDLDETFIMTALPVRL